MEVIDLNNNRLPVYNPDTYYQNCKKARIKRALRKTSNGLGLYIFSYSLVMIFSGTLLMTIMQIASGFDSDLLSSTSVPMMLLEIFISVFSAFITGILYFAISGNSISDTIKVKYVQQKTLWAVVFIGMAVAMFANFAAVIVENNFSLFQLENTVSLDKSPQSPLQNILYIVSTAIVPAFAEEFAFRGILMGTLRKYGDVFAIIASSVLFAAMHGNISQIPFAFILGLIFAYVDCLINSIVPSIIIHFLNNFYSVMIDILNSSALIDDTAFALIYYTLITVFCLLGLLSFIYLSRRKISLFKLDNNYGAYATEGMQLTLKEKNVEFFTSAGVILSLVLFIIYTISSLGVINV